MVTFLYMDVQNMEKAIIVGQNMQIYKSLRCLQLISICSQLANLSLT